MAPETVLEHLGHVLQQENISSEPQALRLLARAARGSMRDALSLTDQAIAFGGGQLQEAAVRQMLGSADRSHVFRLIDALAQGDGKSVVDTSEALRMNGLSAAATLEDMSMVLQRMAVLQAVPSMVEASDTDPEAAEHKRLAALLPPDETQLLYSLCLHGRQELGLAPDEYAALTMVLLRLLAFKPQAAHVAPSALAEKKTLIEAPAQLTTQKSALETARKVEPPHTPEPAYKPASVSQPAQQVQPLPVREMPKPAAPVRVSPQTQDVHAGSLPDDHLHDHPDNHDHSQDHDHDSDAAVVAVPVREQVQINPQRDAQVVSAPTVVTTPEGDVWYEVVQQLVQAEAINALVRELALQSQLVARDSDTWMLRVERESLNSNTSRERLQAALANAGHAVRLAVEVGRVMDSPAKRNAAAAAAKQEAAEALILNDPYVQTLMRDFGAKIVPGSIQPN
jgi:DNA polymerase-3 subunit gamma/tau